MAETEKNPIWQDRIVTDPLILAGKPTIKGTRISVELIMELLDGGRSEADIIRRYSHITLKDIQAWEYAATGAKLSNVTWEDIDAIMDGKTIDENTGGLAVNFKGNRIVWSPFF